MCLKLIDKCPENVPLHVDLNRDMDDSNLYDIVDIVKFSQGNLTRIVRVRVYVCDACTYVYVCQTKNVVCDETYLFIIIKKTQLSSNAFSHAS